MTYYDQILRAADFLRARVGFAPRVCVVLGSGWGGVLDSLQGAVEIPYADVPGMRTSTVPGHAGKWVFGHMDGQPVAVMMGRLHFYEGYPLQDVTFPVRVMRAMGAEILLLTNAAGAVNQSFTPGSLMLVSDHINLTARNPLMGENDDRLGPRFPDMSRVYDPALRQIARDVAAAQRFSLVEGVYCWLTGPSFETPAEIRMVRMLGADAVGMSTVPEAIAAVHGGMRVLALSCMTNMAAGVLDQPLTHQEVLATLAAVQTRYRAYLAALIARV